jgi:hypothetical protein
VKIKHPRIRVQLSGEDGNAFAIITRCRARARKSGLPQAELDAFVAECLSSGSYDRLIQTALRWFDCD